MMDDEYRRYVADVSDSTWPTEVILNRSSAHAGIVIEALFRKAKRLVEILTGELNEAVYGAEHVVRAAHDFLSRDPEAEIHILSEVELDPTKHPFLLALSKAGYLCRVKRWVMSAKRRASTTFHFAVVDGLSYRYEGAREKMEAVIQFGRADVGNNLRNYFRALVKEAELVTC